MWIDVWPDRGPHSRGYRSSAASATSTSAARFHLERRTRHDRSVRVRAGEPGLPRRQGHARSTVGRRSARFALQARVSYTTGVQSLAAVFLTVSLLSAAGSAALHVHRYAGHDHPEHHHGPAAHEHHQAAPRHEHDFPNTKHAPRPEWTPCDPGQHALSLTIACATPPYGFTLVAQCEPMGTVAAARDHGPAVAFTDARAHGPPTCTQAPPRAPPLSTHL